jgi:hypothetical protein
VLQLQNQIDSFKNVIETKNTEIMALRTSQNSVIKDIQN